MGWRSDIINTNKSPCNPCYFSPHFYYRNTFFKVIQWIFTKNPVLLRCNHSLSTSAKKISSITATLSPWLVFLEGPAPTGRIYWWSSDCWILWLGAQGIKCGWEIQNTCWCPQCCVVSRSCNSTSTRLWNLQCLSFMAFQGLQECMCLLMIPVVVLKSFSLSDPGNAKERNCEALTDQTLQ